MNIEELQKEYEAWLANNLPSEMLKDRGWGDAWELMAYINNDDPQDHDGWQLTQEQYAWLADFCERWTAIEKGD